MGTDTDNLRFTLKELIAVVVTIITILGSGYATYYGITSRIQSVDIVLQQQTKQIEHLSSDNEVMKRQLIELTVTLKTKGVIQ